MRQWLWFLRIRFLAGRHLVFVGPVRTPVTSRGPARTRGAAARVACIRVLLVSAHDGVRLRLVVACVGART